MKVVPIDFGLVFGRDWGFSAKLAFTLTAQMVDVMGGHHSELFRDFVQRATQAYLAVRRHHVLIASLALLSVCGRLSCVQSVEDLDYLYGVLCPSASEQQAAAAFSSLLYSVSKKVYHSWNDAGHLVYQAVMRK